MESILTGRVSIAALGDVERFLESAQHLKALAVQLSELRCRESRRQFVLAQQIDTFTQHCGTLALASPRLAELWKQTQDEVGTLLAPSPPAGPLPGAALPAAPAQPPRAPCSQNRPVGGGRVGSMNGAGGD